jgi:hypothetical protein
MEFVITFQQPVHVYERNADPATSAPGMQAWRLYMEAMSAEGVLRGTNRLDESSVTTVRMRDGQRQVQDGPFADTKDLLGGYALIEVPSLDDALQWAARCPSSVEGSTSVFAVIQMRAH